jgi:hypothetical protein
MSIGIAVVGNGFVLAGADSRSFWTDGSVGKDSVEKMFCAEIEGKPFVIAIAGEAEINGKPTIEIVRSISKATTRVEFESKITQCFRDEWTIHFNNYPWESPGEKKEEYESVIVELLIIDSPTIVSVIRVRPLKFEKPPFCQGWANYPIGKINSISHLLEQSQPRNLDSASQFLANMLDCVCENEKSCGFPITFLYWAEGSKPKFAMVSEGTRICATAKELERN